MRRSVDRGGIAELAIAAAAARLGIVVLRPLVDGTRYDLVFDTGARLLRAQCKSGTRHGDVVRAGLRTSRRTASGERRTAYTAEEVDAFAVYCHELDRVFLLPIERFTGCTYVHLRLAPARNNQRAGVNLADAYDLAKMVADHGAIAQLGERLHGMQEVAGSSPASSTP